MQTMFSWDTFYRLPVVGILRGFNWDQIRKLMPAAATGGLCNFEVTMNTDGAAEIIRLLCELAGDRANVGATPSVRWRVWKRRWRPGRALSSRPSWPERSLPNA